VWLEEAHHEWKNDNSTKQNIMYKGRDELYGTLEVEGRYTLVQW
jgi:hypothetical protein